MSYRSVRNDAYVARMMEMCATHTYVGELHIIPKYRVAVTHVIPDPHNVVARTELSLNPSETVRMYPPEEKHPPGMQTIAGTLIAMRNKWS